MNFIQKTHQDKVLTTEIQSKRRSVRSLDREIENKSDIIDELDEEISEKEETKNGLDADITTKSEKVDELDAAIEKRNKEVDGLTTSIRTQVSRKKLIDAEIQTKSEKLKNLEEQINNRTLALQNIQLDENWKENIFKALAALLYFGDLNLKACVSAIQDYACSGRGRGKQYRSFFTGEEAHGIKTFMNNFYSLTKIAATQVACLLVWMATESCKAGKFSDWEKKNVAREVNDVAIGRYDGVIQKYQRGGGMKR